MGKLLSKERFYQSGDGEEPGRSDYDTIIRSTLFRRLQDKAQVLPLESDDYVRTRLTHSLEVSAIGKRLGELVYRRLKEAGKDAWFEHNPETEFSDTLLCAGLVHDIGNPPFGHFGEYAVRGVVSAVFRWMTDNYARRLYRELFSPDGKEPKRVADHRTGG